MHKITVRIFSRKLFSHIHEISIQTTNENIKNRKPKHSKYMKLLFKISQEYYFRIYMKLVFKRQMKKKNKKKKQN